MRSALLLSAGLLLVCAPAVAAPVPAATSTLSPAQRNQLRSEALTFGQQMLAVSSQVSANYYWPVTRPDLLESALTRLYEVARQPLPGTLAAELKKLQTDEALIEYLVQTREKLGVCEALTDRRALLVACQGMMNRLDPHSKIVLEEDRKGQPWGDQPVGLGLELADNAGIGPQRVRAVHLGSPAQKAGIRPGDEVTHVDDQAVRDMPSEKVAGLIVQNDVATRGVRFNEPVAGMPDDSSPRSPMTLTIARRGESPRKITLEFDDKRPESVLGVVRKDDNTWEYLADRKNRIALIRITQLNRGTSSDLVQLLNRLESDGLRGLVLDLRWCPGGFLDEAIGVAGLFADEGVLAVVKGRENREQKYHNTQPKRFLKLPVVVLVNGETSGGAELIAAVLQDSGAKVAGQRTLGKASVQTALYVDVPGASLKLTSGVFVRPSGKNLHRGRDARPQEDWGVRPAVKLEVRTSPDMSKQLRQWWQDQSLRPGSSARLLPLDDPTTDPQGQVAMNAVRAMVK